MTTQEMTTQEMDTQKMDTQEMTCTDVLEELGRIRDYHQGRADSAALLEDELKSLLGKAQVTDEGPGGEPAVETKPEPVPEPETKMATGPRGASPAEPVRRSPRRSNSPPELGNIIVDFTGAENLRDRVRRIAEAAGGVPLSPTVVTRFLIESGQHTGAAVNLRPTVYRAFRDQGHLYRRVGNGCFEIIPQDGGAGQSEDAS